MDLPDPFLPTKSVDGLFAIGNFEVFQASEIVHVEALNHGQIISKFSSPKLYSHGIETRCLIDCVSLLPENLTRRRWLPPPKTLGSSSPPPRFEKGSRMTRRDILGFATVGLGTLIGLLLAVPGVAYIISPLRNKERKALFETLTRLKQLEVGVPRAFADYRRAARCLRSNIRANRSDRSG